MNPNQALKEGLEALRVINEELNRADGETNFGHDGNGEAVEALATAFGALNEWISNGGCLPTAWREPQRWWGGGVKQEQQ